MGVSPTSPPRARPAPQGVVRPATVAAAAAAALSPLWNWLYIVRLGLGLDGAALAVLSLQCTSLSLVGGYTLVRNIRCGAGSCMRLGQRCHRRAPRAWLLGRGPCSSSRWCHLMRMHLYSPRLFLLRTRCACIWTAPDPFCSARPRSSLGQEQAVWHGWSRDAFREWGGYLALALPSVVMICCK